jgi:hypothetical protein
MLGHVPGLVYEGAVGTNRHNALILFALEFEAHRGAGSRDPAVRRITAT